MFALRRVAVHTSKLNTIHIAKSFLSTMVPTSIPSVEVFSAVFPDPQKVNIADYCAGKKVPGYLEQQEALKAAGIEEVIVYCVNDPAVMKAWAADQKIEGSFVTFMADPAATLTKALDMEMTHPGPPSVGIIGRCKRFAIYADDEEIKSVQVSEGPDDPAGDGDPSKSLADNMLKIVLGSS